MEDLTKFGEYEERQGVGGDVDSVLTKTGTDDVTGALTTSETVGGRVGIEQRNPISDSGITAETTTVRPGADGHVGGVGGMRWTKPGKDRQREEGA